MRILISLVRALTLGLASAATAATITVDTDKKRANPSQLPRLERCRLGIGAAVENALHSAPPTAATTLSHLIAYSVRIGKRECSTRQEDVIEHTLGTDAGEPRQPFPATLHWIGRSLLLRHLAGAEPLSALLRLTDSLLFLCCHLPSSSREEPNLDARQRERGCASAACFGWYRRPAATLPLRTRRSTVRARGWRRVLRRQR